MPTAPRLYDRVRDFARDNGTDDTARAAFLDRYRFEVDVVDPDAVASEFDRVARYTEMRDAWAADLDAERLARDAARTAAWEESLRTLPRGPERSVVQAEAGGGAAVGPVDLLAGHSLSPSERAALSAAAAEARPSRSRRIRA